MTDKISDQSARDNHANQLNPTHPEYYQSWGNSPASSTQLAEEQCASAPDSTPTIRDDQNNPNNQPIVTVNRK